MDELRMLRDVANEMNSEILKLHKKLDIAVEAMRKAEILLDNNFGYRSQEDIDAWNIIRDALAEIEPIEKEGA